MSSRNRNSIVALALAGFGLSASAAIANGSFEAPILGAGATTTYAVGSTAITGWTIVGPVVPVLNANVQLVDETYASPGFDLSASDGNQWVDLTGMSETIGHGVETSFQSVVGASYVVTFDVGRLLSRTPASVELKVDGISVVVSTNTGAIVVGDVMNWQSFSVPFTATLTTPTLTFLGSSANGGNPTLAGLDNVAVVPEPGTYAMLLAGLAAVGFVAKRRRS